MTKGEIIQSTKGLFYCTIVEETYEAGILLWNCITPQEKGI